MAGQAAANFFICWIFYFSSRITGLNFFDSIDVLENCFGAPKASGTKCCKLNSVFVLSDIEGLFCWANDDVPQNRTMDNKLILVRILLILCRIIIDLYSNIREISLEWIYQMSAIEQIDELI